MFEGLMEKRKWHGYAFEEKQAQMINRPSNVRHHVQYLLQLFHPFTQASTCWARIWMIPCFFTFSSCQNHEIGE